MTETEKKIADAALRQVGSPYVYGAWGAECTPALRRKYMRCTDQGDRIRKGCPVLSGKQKKCGGCPHQGRLAFDCRGFTHWALAQGGVSITGQGATSQWNTRANWVKKGTVADGVPEGLCCLFRKKGARMAHTGLYLGGGAVVHCGKGVQKEALKASAWTHWAVPKGLTLPEHTALPALCRGDSGDAVRRLQQALLAAGIALPKCGADGRFGPETEAAVKQFQTEKGLSPDGVCGQATWAALTEGET